MKKTIILSITISIIFSACGGGGGGGSSPAPGYTTVITQPLPKYPTDTTPIINVPASPVIDSPIVNTPTTDTSTPTTTPPVSTDTSVVPTTPIVSYLTQEYYASKALSSINANVAYENGYSGKGITVAVVDSGINKSHTDLSSRIVNGTSFVGELYNNGSIYYNQVSFDQLERINISSSGNSYKSPPKIIISGDGTGATAQAILNADGTVNSIVLTNAGSGYTHATVTVDNSGTGGSGLTISNVILGGDDISGHGTFLAGLIAGTKNQYDINSTYNNSIQGVAYEANIMPIKVFDNDGAGYVSMVHKGIEYAYKNNAKVINLSLGSNDPTSITSSTASVYKSALQNNSTMVISAGNEGLSCLPNAYGSISGKCSFPAALPWVNGYSDLLTQNGGWIVVGSVDSNNVITSWSNKAGITKSNYLVAPGQGLISDNLSGSTNSGSGTSYSAAVVSGAVALMYQKYPHLTGNQISEILFQTATDLGATGVDNVYGNGLLNLSSAFAPIGALSITAKNSTPTTYVGGLVLGKSFGTVNANSLNNTIALDSYGRDYQVGIGNNVASNLNVNNFSFDNFQLMQFKHFILGIDELNERALVGVNFDKTSFLFSQTNDLFGSESSGLFDLSKEKTNYFSLRQQFDLFGLNSGINLDYAIGTASTVNNSLIDNVNTLHGYGCYTFIEGEHIGIAYKRDISIYNGGFNFNIPTSRNLDGSLNYNNISLNEFGKPQEEIGLYYKIKNDKLNVITGINTKIHSDLLYEENKNLVYVNMNYAFNTAF